MAGVTDDLRFLASVGEALTDSLDLSTRLDVFVNAVVPRLADWATVNLLGDDGSVETRAIAHRDPAQRATAERLRGPFYANPNAAQGTPSALRSRRPALLTGVDETFLRRHIRPEMFADVLALGADSAFIVPLIAHGRVYGTLSAMRTAHERPFREDDLHLIEELARRAAAAIANAKLFERSATIAEAFQEASLPQRLPRVAGAAFSAYYAPGRAEAMVGGDWYDAFTLDDGRVAVSIGDVAGSGLEAAVIMAAMRQILRGVAHVYADPATMIDAADRTLKAEHPGRIVTAFAAVFDPIGQTLSYANAGHPRPLVRTADGMIRELPSDGLPLGLRDRSDADTRVLALDRDALFIFSTDGLTESTHDPVEGERRLRTALDDPAILARDDTAAAIYDALLADGTNDDVVVLTMRVDPEAGHVQRWAFDTADAPRAHATREAFLAALAAGGTTAPTAFTAELIFSELLGNVVRYAPGAVEVALEQDTGYAPVLHFFDRGPGFDVMPRLPTDRMSERGRGLFLVWSLAEDFSVGKRPGGGSHARAVLPARAGDATAHAALTPPLSP